jgi:hypothetical protein
VKKRIILIGVAVLLLVGAYFLVNKLSAPEKEQDDGYTPSETISIFKTEKDNIVSMTIATPDHSYTFEKKDEKWYVIGKENIKLNNVRIDNLAYDFASINADVLIEDTGDLSLFGFDEPLGTPSIKLADGSEQKFVVGRKTPTGTGYYFKLANDEKIYSVYSSKIEGFLAELDHYRDKVLASIDPATLTEVSIKRKNETIILQAKTEDELSDNSLGFSSWKMVSPYSRDANSYFLENDILKKISGFDVTTFVDDNPSSYAPYGLDNPGYVIGFKYTENKGEETVEKAVNFALGRPEEDNVYVRVEGEPNVYLLKSSLFSYKDIDIMNLIDTLVYIQNIESVDRIRIDAQGEEYILEIKHEGESATYSVNGKTAYESDFKKIYQEIIGLFIRGDVTETPTGEILFTTTFTFNDGRSDDVVQGIAYGDRYVAISVNGKANYYVMKEQVQTMLKKVKEFSENP